MFNLIRNVKELKNQRDIGVELMNLGIYSLGNNLSPLLLKCYNDRNDMINAILPRKIDMASVDQLSAQFNSKLFFVAKQ
jgi:hypothetical protein